MGLDKQLLQGATFFEAKATLSIGFREALNSARRRDYHGMDDALLRVMVPSTQIGMGTRFVQQRLEGISVRASANSSASREYHLTDVYTELAEAERHAYAGHEQGMKLHLARARGICKMVSGGLPDGVEENIQRRYLPSNIDQGLPLS